MPITLNVTTNQEAFDAVVRHLATMTEQSMDEAYDNCAYRGRDGRKCAIGALIDDDQYNPTIDEGARGNYTGIMPLFEEGLIDVGGVDLDLLSRLQAAHDFGANWGGDGFDGWADLRRIGTRHGLNTSVISEVLGS